MTRPSLRLSGQPRLAPGRAATAAAAVVACGWGGPGLAAVCEARSGAAVPTVVELYTSEGCSSCPPADRWLSSLSPRPDLVALAFHVNYWDRLGWVDRYAHPAYTERQRALMAPSGARYVYTPQVLVNGRDWRAWPSLPAAATASALTLQLRRDGDTWSAVVGPRGDPAPQLPAGARLAGYWALLEDGHRSDVRAGENAGATLRHDHVVRQYQPVSAWPAAHVQRWTWQLPDPDAPRVGGVQRRVVFVVTDAATQRPMQALTVAC